jgi:hypothetical protein
MYFRLLPTLCGTMLVLMANQGVKAQQAASVSGTYCGTWASGNSWRMTLRQNGTNVSASLTGRRPDGRPFSGSGGGTMSGSQLAMTITFVSQGQTSSPGTFSGTVSGNTISAAFRFRSGDSAHFTRC